MLQKGDGKEKTDEVPASVSDCGQLALLDDGPDEIGCIGCCFGVEEEVESELVDGVVAQVVHAPKGLPKDLQWILAGSEGEYGVEGC